MKPLMYGYLRVDGDEPDEDILRLERGLAGFAESEGYCLAEIFHEHDAGSQRAFLALVDELQRAEARHVVVPSADHLASNPILRNLMLTSLRYRADAQVWTLHPSVSDRGCQASGRENCAGFVPP